MPTYCYEDESGVIHERVFSMGEAPEEILVASGVARRSFRAERVGIPPTTGWPLTCVASGVNANQAQELREHLANRGCPTEVTNDGDPVYRDAQHRKKALKVRGLHDRSGYY